MLWTELRTRLQCCLARGALAADPSPGRGGPGPLAQPAGGRGTRGWCGLSWLRVVCACVRVRARAPCSLCLSRTLVWSRPLVSSPHWQPLGGAGREGAGARVCLARVLCWCEARPPPTLPPLPRAGDPARGSTGCRLGGHSGWRGHVGRVTAGTRVRHRHAWRGPSSPRAGMGRTRAAWRPFRVSGRRGCYLTSRRGQQPARGSCRAAGWPGRCPLEQVVPRPIHPRWRGTRRGHGQEEAGQAPPWAGTVAAGRVRAPAGTRPPPLWGWGRQGGRVWWDLPWAAASASARPAVSPSCVWTPGCRCAVPLERSSGLAQEPLRETGRCGPKVTLFQPAGEGPDRQRKAARLSPGLGPSAVASGHGARTGGRLRPPGRGAGCVGSWRAVSLTSDSWAQLGPSQPGACQSQLRAGQRLQAQGPLGRQGWGLLSRGPGVPRPARRMPQGAVPGAFSWSWALGGGAGPSPRPTAHGEQRRAPRQPPPGAHRRATCFRVPSASGVCCSEEVWDVPGTPVTVTRVCVFLLLQE